MTISTSRTAEDLIRADAAALGFDACRITDLDPDWTAGEQLADFVARGRHGEMAWMAETLGRRRHPQAMWREARSAIVLGVNYGPDSDPLAILSKPDRAAISVYAQGDDYHDLIKGRLKALGGKLQRRLGGELKVFVDTAPLMEKPLAARAGVGWQGRHTNLVSRDHGSWLFLGVVLTTLDLKPDPPEPMNCGTCRACLDVCPTGAFPAPFQIDARRCISYLTIELKGPIPPDLRPALGNRVYGCDDCLAVCPWNKFAKAGQEARLAARDTLRAPALADLMRLDDAAFRALFAKSPIKRIGRDRFLRNVLYAVGNSSDPEFMAEVERLLDDASALVRGAAVWALSRLASPTRLAALAEARQSAEVDSSVVEEWRRSLAT